MVCRLIDDSEKLEKEDEEEADRQYWEDAKKRVNEGLPTANSLLEEKSEEIARWGNDWDEDLTDTCMICWHALDYCTCQQG